jgi:hypothetical protein
MRLWSLHPRYLDARGLFALRREGLLAQAVLRGRTKGYVHHPQLNRFRAEARPVAFIAEYLRAAHAEAEARGYRFAGSKVSRSRTRGRMTVSRAQLQLEWGHLVAKLQRRDPRWLARITAVRRPEPHPLFRVVAGGVADWERAGIAGPRGVA